MKHRMALGDDAVECVHVETVHEKRQSVPRGMFRKEGDWSFDVWEAMTMSAHMSL